MRIVGLDYGDVRMGFAISDEAGSFAMPLCMIDLRTGVKAVQEVCRICWENEADKLIVGLPINMNGTRGPMVAKVEAFIDQLTKMMTIPIEKWDERLTTSQVERMLIECDMSRGKRKQVRDKLAAQVILQSYLDSMNLQNDKPGYE